MYQRGMQRSQFRRLSMRSRRRNGEPVSRVGQNKHLLKVELSVVTEARRLVSRGIAIAQYCEFAAMQRGRALARSIDRSNRELQCVIIEDDHNERWSWFRTRVDIVRKMTPHNVASGGLRPPSRHLRDV